MITQNTGPSDMLNAIMNENTNIKIVIYIIFLFQLSFMLFSKELRQNINAATIVSERAPTPFPIKNINLLPNLLITMLYIYKNDTKLIYPDNKHNIKLINPSNTVNKLIMFKFSFAT